MLIQEDVIRDIDMNPRDPRDPRLVILSASSLGVR
jgi:hypothetical protein